MRLFDVHHVSSVASTNDEVKRAIDRGVSEGFVCRSDEQAGGYGRQGRTWSSPVGGLYQSVLLRPSVAPETLPTLGLVVGLSIRQALVEDCGLPDNAVYLKWPNDIVCEAGKLAGISSELHAQAVCVGIGVNVVAPVPRPEVGGKYTPAYLEDLALAGATPSPSQVGDAVLERFEECYKTWCREGFAPFASQFNAVSWLAGKPVRVADIHDVVLLEGIARTVDEAGRLLVETPDGLQPAISGEVHLL